MKRVGLYLGFPPEGGGAFQYASSMLLALSSLPNSKYQPVVAHSHPAWEKWLDHDLPVIESHAVATGVLDDAARHLLRIGFPAATWRRISIALGGIESKLHGLACDLWIFPAQDHLCYALPGKTIGTIHDLMHRHERRFPEVSQRGLFSRRERHYRNMCASAEAILVDSEIGRRHVLEAYAPPPSRVHSLPYTPPSYIYRRNGADNFDDRYALPSKYLFYPAQLWCHKNHVRLLEALSIAHRHLPDLHLVLAGSEKNNGHEVRKAAEELHLSRHVMFLGYVPDEDMAELYRRSMGLIMPTFFGPTNIPPLEAMATETPMAVSGIYGMREQSGDAAIYFDPESVESIATAMIRLVTDEQLRLHLIAQAKSRIGELSQAQFNARFEAILETVI